MSKNTRLSFYKPPTPEEVAERGTVLAEAYARVCARKIGSRVMSTTLAFGMGMANLAVLKYFGHTGIGAEEVVAAFSTPVVANTIAQVRTERTQRHDLNHLGEVASRIINDYGVHTAALEQDNLALRQTIEIAGLELPPLNSDQQLQ